MYPSIRTDRALPANLSPGPDPICSGVPSTSLLPHRHEGFPSWENHAAAAAAAAGHPLTGNAERERRISRASNPAPPPGITGSFGQSWYAALAKMGRGQRGQRGRKQKSPATASAGSPRSRQGSATPGADPFAREHWWGRGAGWWCGGSRIPLGGKLWGRGWRMEPRFPSCSGAGCLQTAARSECCCTPG